jgi:hypothetical protein
MASRNGTPSDPDVDWSGVSEPMVRQIFQQAETFMRAQFDAALAADTRAMTMASVFVTLATAIIAGAIAYGDKAGHAPAIAGAFAGALVMLIGAALGVWAARPIDFYFPGNQPEKWFPIRGGDLIEALGGESENYARHIAANDAALTANNGALILGAILGVLSPLIGLVVWALTNAFCRG